MQPILDARPDQAESAEAFKQYVERRRRKVCPTPSHADGGCVVTFARGSGPGSVMQGGATLLWMSEPPDPLDHAPRKRGVPPSVRGPGAPVRA
jgi:hypothetical protein